MKLFGAFIASVVIVFSTPFIAQINVKSGEALVQKIIDKLDKTIVFDQTNASQIKNIFDLKTNEIGESVLINYDSNHHHIKQRFGFENNVLVSLDIDAYYTQNGVLQASIDAQNIIKYIENIYQSPDVLNTINYIWEQENFVIEFVLFENGWGFYVTSTALYNDELYDIDWLDCEMYVGDYVTLKEDFIFKYIMPVKSNKIIFSKSSPNEIAKLYDVDDEDSFYEFYDGISLKATIHYDENDKLTCVWLHYTYECESIIINLNDHYIDLYNTLNSILKITPTSNDSAGKTWVMKTFSVNTILFENGFTVKFFEY